MEDPYGIFKILWFIAFILMIADFNGREKIHENKIRKRSKSI
jgi:hypothetical protein